MANNLIVGERVFLPASRLGVGDTISAFVSEPVLEVADRSVRINFRGEDYWIANSLKSLSATPAIEFPVVAIWIIDPK